MTQRQIEEKIFEMQSYITDRFRDLQRQANTLKNPEDKTKNIQTLAKISDYSTDIQRSYEILEKLMCEEPEEPAETTNSYAFA